jgi:hypothetical protein
MKRWRVGVAIALAEEFTALCTDYDADGNFLAVILGKAVSLPSEKTVAHKGFSKT